MSQTAKHNADQRLWDIATNFLIHVSLRHVRAAASRRSRMFLETDCEIARWQTEALCWP